MSFIDNKVACLYHNRKKAALLRWTQIWRRNHKKVKAEIVIKRRSKRTVKIQRAVGGMSLEDFKKKKNEKPEVRQAAREAALRYTYEYSIGPTYYYFFILLLLKLYFIVLEIFIFEVVCIIV